MLINDVYYIDKYSIVQTHPLDRSNSCFRLWSEFSVELDVDNLI